MIFEVRDYHYRPDLIGAYHKWALDAAKVLRKKLDVVGFWVDDGEHKPEIRGSRPIDSPIGSANVTWIIRWESKAARDKTMETAFAGKDWEEVWKLHPDPNGYLQISSRFMESV
jgi:hypothetical protein